MKKVKSTQVDTIPQTDKFFHKYADSTFRPVPAGSFTLSGGIPFITQTDSITSLTPDGGFFIAFTVAISDGCMQSGRHNHYNLHH